MAWGYIFDFYKIMAVVCTHSYPLDEMILMNTHNIHFRDKTVSIKHPKIFFFSMALSE